MNSDEEYNYKMLFQAIDRCVNYGMDPDELFDTMVNYFAEKAEEHQYRARQFKKLLDASRPEAPPQDTIPEATTPPNNPYYRGGKPDSQDWDAIFGDVGELTKDYLSSNANKFIDNLRKKDYPSED